MTPYPGYCFSRRIQATPRSMIREILKVTERPGIISFGGGLPSAAFLDAEGIGKAAAAVLRDSGRVALQYATTEGYLPLRNWIADRYHDRLGLSVNPDEILITNGSQQTLDLLGRHEPSGILLCHPQLPESLRDYLQRSTPVRNSLNNKEP